MDDYNPNPAEVAAGPQTAPAPPVSPAPPAPEAPPREVPDFQVDTATDGQSIQAAMNILLSPLFRVGYWVLAILCLVMGLLLILLDQGLTFLSGACLFMGLFIILLRLWMPRRLAEKQLKVLRESYGTDAVPLHLVFWPQGVVVNNTISGAHLNIRYDIIKRLIRAKGYLIVQTQAGQSVILPLADVANYPDFVPYLLAKCPQATKKGL